MASAEDGVWVDGDGGRIEEEQGSVLAHRGDRQRTAEARERKVREARRTQQLGHRVARVGEGTLQQALGRNPWQGLGEVIGE